MNELLNEYYKKKKQYLNAKGKQCVNCKRNVGTKFVTEYYKTKRILRMQCGDSEAPCDLDKEIVVMNKEKPLNYERQLREKIINTEKNILKIKNERLYDLIDESEMETGLEKLNEQMRKLQKELQGYTNEVVEVGDKNEGVDEMARLIKRNKEIENKKERLTDMVTNIQSYKEEFHKKQETTIMVTTSKKEPWKYAVKI